MMFSHLFHPESTPVALDNALHYVVFSTLQWKTPNLDVMKKAAKQRFAILYNQPLEHSFVMETLEQAHIQGAMSGVKLVAVHKNLLYLFLSDDVASTTFPAIESLWAPIRELDLNQRLEIDFACENEVYSGRSDYAFWPAVKEVLESNVLGIEQYQVPVHGRFSTVIEDDVESRFIMENVGPCDLPTQTIHPIRNSFLGCYRCSDKDSSVSYLKDFLPQPCHFNQGELEAVKSTSSLRDECLYALLLARLRVNEIRGMKAGDVLNEGRVNVLVGKNLMKTRTVVLSADASALISRYVEASGLSGNDFLFPSARNNKQPMSPVVMRRAFHRWLIEEKIDHRDKSLDGIGQALNPESYGVAKSSVARMLNHFSPLTTTYYLKPRNPEPNA